MSHKKRAPKSVTSTNEVKGEKKDQSTHIHQKSKIDFELKIRERNDLTNKQLEILEIASNKNTKAIFIDGLYGSSKTYLATLASLRLLNQKRVSDIIYIRNPIESSTTGKLGYLKGELSQKMQPYEGPLDDKLAEFLSEGEVKRLKGEDRITITPVGFVRGRSWNCKAIIVDEASSMSWDDLFLILTRCGEFTKIFFIGDSENQNDIGSKSGFKKMFQLFNDQESKNFGIHCFELKELNDIVRSGLLRFVMVKAGLIKNNS